MGTYPKYSVLAFEEPASSKGTPNSPSTKRRQRYPVPISAASALRAIQASKQLGSAKLGNVVTVSLGASVSNFGGYTGQGNKPFTGDRTLSQRQTRSINTTSCRFTMPRGSRSFSSMPSPGARAAPFSGVSIDEDFNGLCTRRCDGCGDAGRLGMRRKRSRADNLALRGPPKPTPPAKRLYDHHHGTFYPYRLPLLADSKPARTLTEWPGSGIVPAIAVRPYA